MKAKAKCDICGTFSTVSSTDCGLICERCFQKEQGANIFNLGLERAIKVIKKYFIEEHIQEDANECEIIVGLIHKYKMKTHLQNN